MTSKTKRTTTAIKVRINTIKGIYFVSFILMSNTPYTELIISFESGFSILGST